MSGSRWKCFLVGDYKSYFVDSFGGNSDKFLLKHLPKPIVYHNCNIQDINFHLCGSYSLYFFYLIERMKYHDAILKMYFHDFKYAY